MIRILEPAGTREGFQVTQFIETVKIVASLLIPRCLETMDHFRTI